MLGVHQCEHCVAERLVQHRLLSAQCHVTHFVVESRWRTSFYTSACPVQKHRGSHAFGFHLQRIFRSLLLQFVMFINHGQSWMLSIRLEIVHAPAALEGTTGLFFPVRCERGLGWVGT